MMLREVDEFYERQLEPEKSCFLTLREIIMDFHPEINHVLKYRMPCFTLKSKPFCYLWKDKKTNWPYILVVKGNLMAHTHLQQGERSKMKRFLIDPNKDLELVVILEILEEASGFY